MDHPIASSSKEICQNIQQGIRTAMTASRAVQQDYVLFKTYPSFSNLMKFETKTVLSMMNGLINRQNIKKDFQKSKDTADKFDALVAVNDFLLDKINNLLDDAEGLKAKDEELVMATLNIDRTIATPNRSLNFTAGPGVKDQQGKVYNLLAAKITQRPQLRFKVKVDNSSSPFIPNIKTKPNSRKPLSLLPEVDDGGRETYPHPYEMEIEKLEPSETFLCLVEPKAPPPVETTPFEYVSSLNQLEALCSKLAKCSEIAVDLEAHSFRTYQGFTCLMQISTRNEDFIVDTLKLREDMHILNEVFSNPKILKVFHGADMDIVWLQRDFAIYVVNMFDTGQASRVLDLAHHSLAYLLKGYCNKIANKQYQLADWRMRPLNQELLDYARDDTHYLLYIYDRMKKDLIVKANGSTNLLKAVFERSKTVCLRKYEKPIFDEETHLGLLKKSRSVLNNRQLFALKHLMGWRDKIARQEDESTGYVLPNHMLLQIAEVLPREQQGILACCNPVPPLVKQQLNELHILIMKARELPLVKTSSRKHLKDVHVNPLITESIESVSSARTPRIMKKSIIADFFAKRSSRKRFKTLDDVLASPFERNLRFAVVCSSNQNRSMEGHNVLAKKGFLVRSFGSGNQVKLPGPSADKPNVYNFGHPYDNMYTDLTEKDKPLYTQNGILHMLDRNRRIKPCPERFHDCFEKFDVIYTCEERVYDQCVEELANRTPVDNTPVHVINFDIQDNHEEATIGAFLMLDLSNLLTQCEDLDNEIDELLQDFELKSKRRLLHTIAFQ
ncbi:Exosome component 10 [Halotydeus destructor]|nr:Exosome component 10 [Halotydeus destructor]